MVKTRTFILPGL